MLQKTVVLLILVFLLATTFFALSIKLNLSGTYNATNTVFIKNTGEVLPNTAPINKTGDLYTLTDNINTDQLSAIVIEKSNIILDGSGFTLQGSNIANSKGISLTGTDNVTIRDLWIESFDDGIYMQTVQHSTINGNYITANKYAGIYLYYSYYNNITNNRLSDSSTPSFGAIRLDSSMYNRIIGNYITSDYYGIYVYDSQSNYIFHNNILYNAINAYITWDLSSPSMGNTWDDGYPSGGNHWSDYSGVDLNHDGIGDSAYQITVFDGSANLIGYEQDRYPLMNAWSPFVVPEYLLGSIIALASCLAAYGTFRILRTRKGLLSETRQ